MAIKYIYISVLFLCFQSSFALTCDWGNEQLIKVQTGRNLMILRKPIVLNNDKVIEIGYKKTDNENIIIYWIMSVSDNKFKKDKEISVDRSGFTTEKLYKKMNPSQEHAAYRAVAIPNTNRFIEFVFTWYESNKNALYRIGTLKHDNTIKWTEYKEFCMNNSGEVYNASFCVTESGYLLGIISVSPDFETEKYTCYYNYGKIETDKINWNSSSFNKILPEAKHEVICCNLEDSNICLIIDPGTDVQKYSICKINNDRQLTLGSIKELKNFVVSNEPVYIESLKKVLFPGEYENNKKFIPALASYSIDYTKIELTNEEIHKLPDWNISVNFTVDYMPVSQKIMFTEYNNNKTAYYSLADIKK